MDPGRIQDLLLTVTLEGGYDFYQDSALTIQHQHIEFFDDVDSGNDYYADISSLQVAFKF